MLVNLINKRATLVLSTGATVVVHVPSNECSPGVWLVTDDDNNYIFLAESHVVTAQVN